MNFELPQASAFDMLRLKPVDKFHYEKELRAFPKGIPSKALKDVGQKLMLLSTT